VRDNGFSLVETLVASAILITGIVSLAQLVVVSSRARAAAGARSLAALLVVDKIERLRALPWTVDDAGAPVSAPELGVSPADALERDVPGYVDAPGGWPRRWSVQPLPSDPADTLVVQVRVVTPGGADVRMATVRTRRAD